MPTPPAADQRPHAITRHGDTRVDPYYWLMDRESDEVIARLRAENDFAEDALSHLRPLEEEIFVEIKSRIEETDISVPVRRRGWWYYERTIEGRDYPVSCRWPAPDDDPTPPDIDPLTPLDAEQVILDENREAEGHDYFSVGVLAVSPDDEWVAVGVDLDGSERHRVTFRSLHGGAAPDDVLDDVHYGFTWALDSRHVFYTRVDDAMRPWQLWRHELGTSADDDALIWQEDDALYTVSVGRTRDDAVVLMVLSSSMTTEVHYIDAAAPTAAWTVIEPRSYGVEYEIEHFLDGQGRGWWLKITNEDAKDFCLLAKPTQGGDWRTVLAHRPGNRLDGVEAFADFLVTAERVDGSAAVRVVPLDVADPFGANVLATSWLVDAGPAATVVLSANAEYHTRWLRVMMTSMVTPRLVADVDVATRAMVTRKQQRVRSGYDAERFVTSRLWFRASDGVAVPASLVVRRDLVDVAADGTLSAKHPLPLLLYGYGSYESSMDPYFSTLRLSLLERGCAFVVAHVRGGGELGRSWYEMGRLAQKATTFSDFITVARGLCDEAWTTPSRLALRGESAGGLLMGAVMNRAPELAACVVALVPFVDVLTTMLDPSLPLTVGEYEEWGNPDESAQIYRLMKGYSPYDNVRATDEHGSAVRYPALYASGGLNDPRVGFWEPLKWVLKLRDANADNRAYLRTDLGAGHAGPSGRYDVWRDEARIFAFVLHELGLG